MSFIGFLTGENEKIARMESLVNGGAYREALNIDLKNWWALSKADTLKVWYLEAICRFELGEYGLAQDRIVWIINYPGDIGVYKEKTEILRKKILERERGNTIVFPQEPFAFFIEDCNCSDFNELRVKEGIDTTNYYEKIQIFYTEINKRLTFYWKPLTSDESELFIYLGDDMDGFCKKIDENTVERSVYTKSLKNIGDLYNKGKNGACLTPSLYRTVDFTKPDILLKGNTYVLGIKTRKSSFSQIDEIEIEIAQLLETFDNIMSDIDKGPTTVDKLKIYASYFGQGVLDKVLTKEFGEVGKLISIIIKNK